MPTYVTRARLTADAVNRTWRTILGMIVVEVGNVVVPELLRMLQDERTVWDWNAAHSLGRIAAAAAFAFVLRRYLDPSAVPTPLPPADPGVPAEPA